MVWIPIDNYANAIRSGENLLEQAVSFDAFWDIAYSMEELGLKVEKVGILATPNMLYKRMMHRGTKHIKKRHEWNMKELKKYLLNVDKFDHVVYSFPESIDFEEKCRLIKQDYERIKNDEKPILEMDLLSNSFESIIEAYNEKKISKEDILNHYAYLYKQLNTYKIISFKRTYPYIKPINNKDRKYLYLDNTPVELENFYFIYLMKDLGIDKWKEYYEDIKSGMNYLRNKSEIKGKLGDDFQKLIKRKYSFKIDFLSNIKLIDGFKEDYKKWKESVVPEEYKNEITPLKEKDLIMSFLLLDFNKRRRYIPGDKANNIMKFFDLYDVFQKIDMNYNNEEQKKLVNYSVFLINELCTIQRSDSFFSNNIQTYRDITSWQEVDGKFSDIINKNLEKECLFSEYYDLFSCTSTFLTGLSYFYHYPIKELKDLKIGIPGLGHYFAERAIENITKGIFENRIPDNLKPSLAYYESYFMDKFSKIINADLDKPNSENNMLYYPVANNLKKLLKNSYIGEFKTTKEYLKDFFDSFYKFKDVAESYCLINIEKITKVVKFRETIRRVEKGMEDLKERYESM